MKVPNLPTPLIFPAVLVLAFLCGLSAVQAQTNYTTTITASTNWSSSSGWSPVGVPGSGDTAIVSATAAAFLRLTADTSVGTFNMTNSGAAGILDFTSESGAPLRSFTVGTLNFQIATNSGALRFANAASNSGFLAVNIGTLNVASNVSRSIFVGNTLAPSPIGPILNSFTVGNLNMSNGILSVGAVRRSTSDPVNVNLGNITMSGGTINISETGGAFANTVEANSLSGSNATIRVSGSAPASLLQGTLRLIGSGSTSSSIALQDGGTLRQLNLVYAGTGTQTLTGSNNYSGTTTISSGALNIQNASALGTNASGTTVESGGALEVQGSITVTNEALTISGSGVSSGGALRSISGVNAYNGDITLGANARINVDAGTLNLTNAGTITGSGFGLTVGGAGNLVVTRVIGTGTGSLTKDGAGTLTLNEANTYTGDTIVTAGELRLAAAGRLSDSTLVNVSSGATANFNSISDTVRGLSGAGAVVLGSGTLTTSNSATDTFSGAISGTGGYIKRGAGTQTLSGANSFSGTTTVSAGTLSLNRTGGPSLGSTTNVTVESTAALLISQSGQVNDSSAVTLSGGTIQRGAGVTEVFGNLNLTAASFLDFGTGAIGSLQFGTYTPTLKLNVTNFLEGNTLIFASNIGAAALTNSTLFSFDNAFSSNWNGTTFTVTAVPEPSTMAAALGLAAVLLWPNRRRLMGNVRGMLGLRSATRR